MDTNLRVKVIERDRLRCRGCAGPIEEVHHIIFRSQGGKDEEANLVGLCKSCHGKAHGLQRDPLPAWVLQSMIHYNKWRVCCTLWRDLRNASNCVACDNRSSDYQCLLTGEQVSPSDGCDGWVLRDLKVHR